MVERSALRRGLTLAAAGPAVIGLLVLAAGPAQAAISNPPNGVTFGQDASFTISASARSSSSLSVVDPNGTARVVSGPNTTLSYRFDTGCYSTKDPSCAQGRHPAINGVWSAKLTGGETDTRTFTLKIPAHSPAGVTAALTANREITVSWQVGDEPDLAGWAVTDGNGALLRDGLTSSACASATPGATCQTAFEYGPNDEGARSFAVVAHRATCPGCSAVVDSAPSSSASATLPPKPTPPPPSPTPSAAPSAANPGGGGGTAPSAGPSSSPTPAPRQSSPSSGIGHGTTGGSGSSGSRGTGGTGTSASGPSAIGTGVKVEAVQAQRKAFALSFSSFAPKLGIAKLPPLPQALALSPTVAGEQPLADGTYQKTLGYRSIVQQQKVSVVTQAGRAVSRAVSGALDSARFGRLLAGALVLLLIGAHLRRWLAQSAR